MSLVATIAAMTLPQLIGLGVGVGAAQGLISSAVKGEDVGKGMLIGAGTGLVTAGVGAGVGSVAGSALTSGLGGLGAGAVVGGVAGAAGGAAGSAMKGEDVGKGALLGGAGGAVTGAAAGALGGAANGGGAETVAGPGAVPTGVAPAPPPVGPGAAPIGGTPPVAGTAPVAGAAPGAGAAPAPVAPLAKIAPEPPNALVAGINKTLGTNATGKEMIGGLGVIGTGAGSEYTIQGIKGQDAINATASEEDKARGLAAINQGSSGLAGVRAAGLPDGTGPLGGLGSIGRATGGITALAHGGQVALGDGAYIIPADVVSALGNGSSKAGADYLRRLMIEVRKEAVNLQGMGAAKKHVS